MTPNASLPADVATLQQMVRELLGTVAELRTTIVKQNERIDYLARQLYGRRSERLEGPTLFDELAVPDSPDSPAAPEPVKVEEEVVVKQKGHGRKPKPRDLPRERVELDLTEAEKLCPCCQETRVRIGEEVTSRLDYRPACLFYRDLARPTYICRNCEKQGENVQAMQRPLPPEPIAKGICAPGLLAHVIVSKYVDHLPLYRLESILGRLGWDVSRSTLCDQVMACAAVLSPVYELMCRRVRQSFALHADDTSITLLNPHRTGYAWVYLGDECHPYTVFELTTGRKGEFPEEFLRGYQGFIHADGYTGYNPLYNAGATHVGCWMHVRRYFFEAKDTASAQVHEALARIRSLYAVEAEIKDQKLTGDAVVAYRRQRAGPVIDAFADWLAAEVPRALPKSKYGEAIIYASNQWPTLTRYLNDHRLRIDNGPAEQAIRPLAVGRRNWLHIAGDGGLSSAAILLSFAASIKRNAVPPWQYLKHLLTELPSRPAGADLTDLLPDAWSNATTAG